jgi:hypothetical protein
MPPPAYKASTGQGDNTLVEDYVGEKRRPAVGAEADLLPFRKFFSPACLEGAFMARHGLAHWDAQYDELQPTRYATTSRMFGS